MTWTSLNAETIIAQAEGFERDYREAEEQRKALKSHADRLVAIGCAIVERPGERPSLIDELDKAVTDYYRDSREGRFGS